LLSLADDCGTVVNAGITCADPSWTLYQDAFDWCCAPGFVGLALGDGHCEPASLTYTGNYASTVSSQPSRLLVLKSSGLILVDYRSFKPTQLLLPPTGQAELSHLESRHPELLKHRSAQLLILLLPLLRDRLDRIRVRVRVRLLLRRPSPMLELLLNITPRLWLQG
jgi:hypothetical protein